MRRHLLTAACVLCAVSLVGCASGSDESTGVRIGDETLKQFKAGVTTEAWLLAVLGPPTTKSPVEGIDNTFVYRYATGEQSSGLASIFSGSHSRNTAVTYFIITDGLVTRFWADRTVQYTTLGTPVEQPTGEKQGGK